MKRNLTRLLALLAAAVLMLSLAACGKESGADVTGRYNCIAVAYDGENFTAPDGGDSYVTLKKGGKGEISSELNFELTWKLDGENFSGSYTIFGIDVPVAGTLKDGVLEIEDEGEGVVTRYLKEGMDTPEWAQSLEAAPNEDGRLAGRYTLYAMSIGGDYYDYAALVEMDEMDDSYLQIDYDAESGYTGELGFDGEEPETFTLDDLMGNLTFADGTQSMYYESDEGVIGVMFEELNSTIFFALDSVERAVPADAKPVSVDDPLLNWWNGDWYGWWYMYGCKGSYEDIELKYWDGSLLSLELTVSRPDGEIYRDVYYFDFADEASLSAEDVLARMGLSWESLTPALIRAAVRAHDRMMQAQNGPFTSALAADALALRAQTVLAAQDARLPFYPNGDGTLTVWLNLAAGAGAGWMQKAFVIDPNETASPLSASYEFVTAEVAADGAVAVEYHERGDAFSGADYQKIHDFALDTPYRIDGCFGRYTGLFIGNIGAGFEPYLFLLTENGTLEYVDLFRCARYETYVCGGPVYGLSDVTALSAGMGEDADRGCATVWALDASGAKHDLLESVYLSDGLPGGMTGEFAADSGGSRCSLSFSEIDGLRAQSGGTAYTGFPLRLGMNADGLVWTLDLWDGAGGETLSICAILPGNGMLVLTQLAGGSPFGLTPGETMYLPESFG